MKLCQQDLNNKQPGVPEIFDWLLFCERDITLDRHLKHIYSKVSHRYLPNELVRDLFFS